MTTIGLVLDFVGVMLIAISSVGFVDLPGGGHYAPASLITSGRTRRLLLGWGWSPEKASKRAGRMGWGILLVGLALQFFDSLR